MFTLTYESIDDGVETFHEVKIDDNELVSWPSVLEHMLNFLFNSGYIVDRRLVDEMVAACEDIHSVSLQVNEGEHPVVRIEHVGEWIEWKGDIHSPVNDGVYIDVKFRCGKITYHTPVNVDDGNPDSDVMIKEWSHDGSGFDIMAYRVCP